jgi:hypothetical protein
MATTTAVLTSAIAELDASGLLAAGVDQAVVPAIIRETLRKDPPFPFVRRRVPEDLKIDGQLIEAEEWVTGCILAAHHDPDRWPDPHRFRLDRPPGVEDLAFRPRGASVRRCQPGLGGAGDWPAGPARHRRAPRRPGGHLDPALAQLPTYAHRALSNRRTIALRALGRPNPSARSPLDDLAAGWFVPPHPKVQVHPAALQLHQVELSLAVLAPGLHGQDLRVSRQVLQLCQQLSHRRRHAPSVATRPAERLSRISCPDQAAPAILPEHMFG